MNSGAEPIHRLVLDTSAYSHFRAGHEEVLDRITNAELVYLPTVVLGELEAGFEMGRRPLENRRVLAEFLAESFVVVRPTTPKIARHYGKLFSLLKRAGTPIPTNDIWIAATTFDCGGHLLTFDRHFALIGHLEQTVLPTP